ncbi:MAG: hypothetical protein WCH92_07205 [Betaproteobacteria bacterium]
MNTSHSLGFWWAWPLALAAYVLFRAWYDNLRGPLSPEEIEKFMNITADLPGPHHTDRTVLREFLEADDGKEFVMCNLVKLFPHQVAHPFTGALTPAQDLLQEYVKQFVGVLLSGGGHPVVASRKVAGYIDAWNAPPDPGWSIAGMMRYRSRRDMMILATNEKFLKAHPFKHAAVQQTFSFPTQVVAEMVLRPRSAVGLVLSLVAALVHLGSLLYG